MNGLPRLRRARRMLMGVVLARAVLRGAAAAAATLVLAAAIDAGLGLAAPVRALVVPAALGGGLAAGAVTAWRSRAVLDLRSVALWLEARVPALRYALVTLVDAAPPRQDMLEQVVSQTRWRPAIVRAAGRALTRPLLPLGGAALLLLLMPSAAVRRVTAPRPGDALGRIGNRGDPLATLVVTVRNPAYAGRRDTVLDDPVAVTALEGATLAVDGRAGPVEVAASVDGEATPVRALGERWRVVVAMPTEPAALRLSAGTTARVVILDPVTDSAPRVVLRLPARDTVLRVAGGVLPLAAEADDDVGLDRLWLEYIVSAGEGETYAFRSGALPAADARGRRSAEHVASLRLDTLGLAPGNVIHVRAAATDRNDVTGPGRGVSETRTLRIARPDEYDSVAIAAAPPIGGDTAMLSQRMLIMRAETLQARRPRLRRERVVDSARALARDQTRLRRQVGDVVFLRLGLEPMGEHAHGDPDETDAGLTPDELLRAAEAAAGNVGVEALDFHDDESPVVAINRPLLEAYNAMWDAARELDVGEPGRALPHMHAALEAIQRARRAERIYLRGRPPAVAVDLARARLAGDRRPAAAAPRSARTMVTDDRAAVRLRLEWAMARAAADPAAGLDSLAALRVAVTGRAPGVAAALDRLMLALRAGRDPAGPLADARVALAGTVRVGRAGAPWTGVW